MLSTIATHFSQRVQGAVAIHEDFVIITSQRHLRFVTAPSPFVVTGRRQKRVQEMRSE